jgi:hypothetical protein
VGDRGTGDHDAAELERAHRRVCARHELPRVKDALFIKISTKRLIQDYLKEKTYYWQYAAWRNHERGEREVAVSE